MRKIQATLATSLLVSSLALPARADFQYTETSQITGGSLMGVMKFAGVFARGEARKEERDAMQPTSTTHSVKGGRLRTDNADGTSLIIDLDGKRFISVNNMDKTYAIATFDQVRDAMQQALQNVQAQQQAEVAQHPEAQNAQLNITPTVKVTPGTGNRVILGQSTNETRFEMDMTMQATGTGQSAPPPGQPTAITMVTNMDTFVAPDVAGYEELAQFYRRMAQEVTWFKLPPSIHVADPRVSQNMSELQQNSAALKGFPMLSYVNMSMVPVGQSPDAQAAQNAQTQQPPPPPPQQQTSSSDDSIPTSTSAALTKGLGGLFGRKKSPQANQSSTDQSGASGSAAVPNPNANPNDLIEITTQVAKFSNSSLDGSLFDVPAGYTQVQVDPTLVMAGRTSQPRAK